MTKPHAVVCNEMLEAVPLQRKQEPPKMPALFAGKIEWTPNVTECAKPSKNLLLAYAGGADE